MVFSSIIFLSYFFPIFILVYSLLPHKYRNYWILLTSVGFYAWGAPKFIFWVLGVILVDFYIVKSLHKSSNQKIRRQLLGLSVIIKIGLLAYFKYANFFVDNLNSLLNSFGVENVTWTNVALPIGISFFIFQAVTYSVDVYRKISPPLKTVGDYLLYILLFPQLIAGPIVRFNEISEQIYNRQNDDNLENKLIGFYRFIIGLSKKVLIANVLAAEADAVFAMTEIQLNTYSAWVGILAYTFQIYFDFSGYSDMAIGLGRMMGFKFPENFNNPYISLNITDFWRRWHMTLGTWMRDYLYIPLGGNRVHNKFRIYFNLWVVFLISGLWHGAAWNFILWGAFHGFFLILDKLFLIKWLKQLGKYPSILITFFFTIIGWVIFRAESTEQINFFLNKMFVIDSHINFYWLNNKFWWILAIAIFFAFSTLTKWGQQAENYIFYTFSYSNKVHLSFFSLAIILLLLSYGGILSTDFNPFIYFRF